MAPERRRPAKPLMGDGGRSGGFSLIEVLVAFTILGLAFGALMQAFGDGIHAVDDSAVVTRATLLAQSRMARLGADEDLTVGDTQGRTDDALSWRATVREWNGPVPVPSERLVEAYSVAVEVSWEASGARRSVRLESLKLGTNRP